MSCSTPSLFQFEFCQEQRWLLRREIHWQRLLLLWSPKMRGEETRCLSKSQIHVSYGGGRRRQTSASIFMAESNNLFGDFAWEQRIRMAKLVIERYLLTWALLWAWASFRTPYAKETVGLERFAKRRRRRYFTIFNRLASSFKSSMRLRADSRISSCRTFNSFSNWASKPAFSESNFATYSCNLSLKSFSISKRNPDHRRSLSLHRNLPAVRELASERSCCCWACVSATIFLIDSVTASLISSVRLREYSSTCRCVDPGNRQDQFRLHSLSLQTCDTYRDEPWDRLFSWCFPC